MSFIISVFVNEGIVLASDSRTTYSQTQIVDNKIVNNIGLHTTDTADKIFLGNSRTGISACRDSSINGIPIARYINNYIRESINDDTDIDSVPHSILKYFRSFSPIPNTNFIVAGYKQSDNKLEQRVYKVRVSNENIEKVDTTEQGATWDGEVITLTKLIQPTAIKGTDGKYIDLPYIEIPWKLFTLKDAIDFAKYAVDITINTMRHQLVSKTVGGPVDILLIKPNESLWIQKKDLY